MVILAHCYKEDKHEGKVDFWLYSEKYDGVRAHWTGEKMMSRNGLEYAIPDFFRKELQTVVDDNGKPVALDGEIWFGYSTFTTASGEARRDDNKNIPLWEAHMRYMVFDMPYVDSDFPIEERIKLRDIAIQNAGNPPHIIPVQYNIFDPTKTTIAKELERVEALGGEGLVLRRPGSLYVHSRSHDMLKVKSFEYREATILEYEMGAGKYNQKVGSLVVRAEIENDEGVMESITFKVGSGLIDWQRYAGDKNTTPQGNWSSPNTQKTIDALRREYALKTAKKADRGRDTLVNIIKTKIGKERVDAIRELNSSYASMPLLGNVITFRYKELTKTGKPSFPTFCGVRDYE